MAELLAASDRIVVMASGRIVGEVPRQKLEPGDSAHLSAAERLQYAERELQYVIQNVNAYVN